MEKDKCGCCLEETILSKESVFGEYICYCNKVTEQDIVTAIKEKGAKSVDEVINITGAMVNSNCKVNNPKGTCCYTDIVLMFEKWGH